MKALGIAAIVAMVWAPAWLMRNADIDARMITMMIVAMVALIGMVMVLVLVSP